jgi:hypothetical protein
MTITKKTPVKKVIQAPKVMREYVADPQELIYRRFVQRVQKWQALENFRELCATGQDWKMLEYWLYFTQCLIAEHNFETLEQKAEMQERIEVAFTALGAASRNYNTSKYTFMYMTKEERDDMRAALLLGDALLAVSDDDLLKDVINHVRKILD